MHHHPASRTHIDTPSERRSHTHVRPRTHPSTRPPSLRKQTAFSPCVSKPDSGERIGVWRGESESLSEQGLRP
eukprot:2677475-Rhodomonas_salina.1